MMERNKNLEDLSALEELFSISISLLATWQWSLNGHPKETSQPMKQNHIISLQKCRLIMINWVLRYLMLESSHQQPLRQEHKKFFASRNMHLHIPTPALPPPQRKKRRKKNEQIKPTAWLVHCICNIFVLLAFCCNMASTQGPTSSTAFLGSFLRFNKKPWSSAGENCPSGTLSANSVAIT